MTTVRTAQCKQPDLQRLAASPWSPFPTGRLPAGGTRTPPPQTPMAGTSSTPANPTPDSNAMTTLASSSMTAACGLRVRSQALAGVPLAIRALAHLLHWNPNEFQEVISFTADPPTEA